MTKTAAELSKELAAAKAKGLAKIREEISILQQGMSPLVAGETAQELRRLIWSSVEKVERPELVVQQYAAGHIAKEAATDARLMFEAFTGRLSGNWLKGEQARTVGMALLSLNGSVGLWHFAPTDWLEGQAPNQLKQWLGAIAPEELERFNAKESERMAKLSKLKAEEQELMAV